MNISLSKRYFLISLLIIMAVFLPTLYSGVLGMDDLELLDKLSKIYSDPDYAGLFFINKSTVYYRPFLTLINLIDYKIWGHTISGFHLTNYLFHILNSVLLYKISIQLFKDFKTPHFYASTSMLIFALNPLTCESVAWISGRSDILGTFFSLLAVNSYLFKNKIRFVLTPIFALCGFFCKENAFAVLPIIVVLDLILNYNGLNSSFAVQRIDTQKKLQIVKSFLLWCLVLLIPLIAYILIRTAGDGSFENDITRITSAAAKGSKTNGSNISGYLIIFPAIAFYLKKLVIPFPLNFSISSINVPLYSVLFIIFLVSSIYCIIKKYFNFILVGVLLVFSFLPALPIAIGGVAWTPFAERYLYLSLCVWGISISYFLNHLISTDLIKTKTGNFLIVCLILVSITGTLKRESDWNSNKKLFDDTLNKIAPNNYKAIFNYAVSYNGKNRIKYLRQAEVASKDTDNISWRSNLYRAIAYYYAEYNLPENYINISGHKNTSTTFDIDYTQPEMSENEIISEVFKNIDISLAIHSNHLGWMESAVIVLKLQPKDKNLQKQVFERAKKYYNEAYKIKPTAFLMYRIGNLEKLLHQNEKAAKCFNIVISKFPNSEFAGYAKTRLRKFKEEGLIK